jgi:hypothetical protein
MDDESYLQYCRALLAEFAGILRQRTGSLDEQDSFRQLALAFRDLAEGDGDLYEEGPALVSRLFTTYPDFAPTFPRELLWFFGGECLHYMPDEEIDLFQQLDEKRRATAAAGDTLDLREARANLLKLQ